ncbi:MAG: NAD(P)/FAD-dependent oxidoreductase [Acidobacteria bacterium]|nr:MAG: NAD(P)/FAD-dependent oxidoreductase [Acidobacteriota bacterium]
MGKTYDAVVIGGGHNGLTCAAYLARAGRSVLVLERREVVGGAAVTEEVYPGFKFSVCSYVVSLLRPQVIEELELPRHGLEILPLDGTLTPLPDGDYLMRWHDGEETYRELARHSAADAEAYSRFGELMYFLCRAVRPTLDQPPPDPFSLRPSQLRRLLALGRSFARSRDHLYDLARLMTASAADLVEGWFETEALRATLSASGIIGTFLGPRSPTSAYVMLHHYMGELDGVFRAWGLPKGGMSGVSDALLGAARAHGAEVRTGAGVASIRVVDGRATGVVLEDGEEISARVVASGLDPKRTFEQLVEPQHLPPELRRQVARFRIRGSSGKVNLALDALPRFTCLERPRAWTEQPPEAYLRGAISISPSIDYLEEAYDDAKYGSFSRRPYMDIVIPTLADPTMAPPGKHVMSIFVQYAPYELAAGRSWPQEREAFGDAVVKTLAEYAPGLEELILHRQVLTPWDLEQTFGLTQGNIFHGELTLEQLFFLRPAAGWAEYAAPVAGLYLCASATHPGGGVMAGPGRLAAQRILRDWGDGG